MEAKQTSLIELLEAVPVDARLVVDDGPHSTSFYPVGRMCHGAAAALRERLAQPKQEPVAWIYSPLIGDGPKERRLTFVHPSAWGTQLGLEITPLYAAPKSRQWQRLTDEEIKDIVGRNDPGGIGRYTRELFRKIEDKLKEKNT